MAKPEVMETQAIVVRDRGEVTSDDFMPLMTVEKAVERKNMVNQFTNRVLVENLDYGMITGGRQVKVLLKPGAEKLCSIFGLSPKYVKEMIVEDWTGAQHSGEPLFSYEYRCQLWRGDRFMGEAIGSCNSWESKYRYRWINEDVAQLRPDFRELQKRGGRISEPKFAVDKAETSGKYGKPAAYWQQFKDAIAAGTAAQVERPKKDGGTMACWEIDSTQYRIPNPDVADVINTCQKMAQKRALVAAVLVVTNCSDAFTQDIEDFSEEVHHEPAPVSTETSVLSNSRPAPRQVKMPTQDIGAEARRVPKELQQVFLNVDKDVTAAMDAYSRLEGMLIKKAGDAGIAEYDRITAKFNKEYPNGTADKSVHKTMMLDLWDALQLVQPEKQPEKPTAAGVTMEDVPK